MRFLNDVVEIVNLLYGKGWDERNGGNISYLLDKQDVKEIKDKGENREIEYDFDLSELRGKYFIISATGKYFRNAVKNPSDVLGAFKVISNNRIKIIWGFENGGRPTSELPTHLKCHIERLKKDANHRLVIHCHPTNLIAMTHVHPLDELKFTETLWKMQTESIVVFPEGVGVLPWMICGGNEIGVATSNKIKEYKSVVWDKHGIFCTGNSLDEVFGLIETIEKAAEIYIMTRPYELLNPITNEELISLAREFKINYKKGIID